MTKGPGPEEQQHSDGEEQQHSDGEAEAQFEDTFSKAVVLWGSSESQETGGSAKGRGAEQQEL